MAMWSPWRGCRRYSEGCRFCYIHKGDLKRGVDTETVVRTDSFTAPIDRRKNGTFKMSPGQMVYLCFQTDFLLPDADGWRGECWEMIRERSDLRFLFLTKRVERFADCTPSDWGDGYDNVIVGCTVENQETADYRLAIFEKLSIKHRNVIAQPLLERIDIEKYLAGIELCVVGGESDRNARTLNYDWVLDIREQCRRTNTHFEFRQCGTHFVKDGVAYTLQVKDLCSQARKAGLNF